MRLALPFVVLFSMLACEPAAPTAPAEPACALSLDTVVGQTFVMWEALGDGTEVKNPQARLKFVKQDGKVVAKYTVKSLGNVYDYTCAKNSDVEYRCTTEPQFTRICLSLESHKEGSCTAEKIKELGFDISKEAFDTAKAETSKVWAQATEANQLPRFKMMNNNLGNPIQGVLFAKIKPKKCRLSVDDMYYVVHDGKRKEDFNPVGTNPFVVDGDHDYLFEDCPNARVLADLTTPELPEKIADIPAKREHEVGKDVHFFYVGQDAVKAEEGCTYALDTYANWDKVTSAVAITPGEEGKLVWSSSHAFTAEGRVTVGGGIKGGIFHMVRHKTCAGKSEIIDTVCSVASVK